MNTIIHPVLTPEYFPVSPFFDTSIVKSLYVSSEKDISPQIITDTLENVLDTFYPNTYPFMYPLGPYVHFFCEYLVQYVSSKENYVATQYYRNYLLRNHGFNSKDVIRGPVIFFGSYDLKNNMPDELSHSVPYNVVEEILAIYDLQFL